MSTTHTGPTAEQVADYVVSQPVANGPNDWYPARYDLGASWFPTRKQDQSGGAVGTDFDAGNQTPALQSDDDEELDRDEAQRKVALDDDKDPEKSETAGIPAVSANGHGNGTQGGGEKAAQGPGGAAGPPGGAPGRPPFEVPDGGLVAWLQVAGGFALFFNTWYVAFLESRYAR